MNEKTFLEWREAKDKDPVKAKKLLTILVQENDPLVKKYAARVAHTYRVKVDEDLLQSARIGLLRALNTLDLAKASLSTWAWHWVRYECQLHIQRSLPYMKPKHVRIPKEVYILADEIRLLQGREPEAHELGIPSALWQAAQESTWTSSLDESAHEKEEEALTYHDVLPSKAPGVEETNRMEQAMDQIREYRRGLQGVWGKLFDAVYLNPSKEMWFQASARLKIKRSVAKELLARWEADIRALVLGWNRDN